MFEDQRGAGQDRGRALVQSTAGVERNALVHRRADEAVRHAQLQLGVATAKLSQVRVVEFVRGDSHVVDAGDGRRVGQRAPAVTEHGRRARKRHGAGRQAAEPVGDR